MEKVTRKEKQEILARIKDTTDINEILAYTVYEDIDIRQKAVRELCPCRVKDDNEEFWLRIFQMVEDPDPKVRYNILHIICDGSPDRVESQVVEALEKFNRDSDKEIRRRAHKVLATYSRTGKWNILWEMNEHLTDIEPQRPGFLTTLPYLICACISQSFAASNRPLTHNSIHLLFKWTPNRL